MADDDDLDNELEDKSRAVNNAYTGMLAISLLALIVGCVLLYLDYSQYPTSEPPPLEKAPTALTKDKDK
jgi:hypothetical protein